LLGGLREIKRYQKIIHTRHQDLSGSAWQAYIHWWKRPEGNSLLKDVVQNNKEKITQNPKPQYTQISLSHNIDYSPKDRNTNSSFAENKWRLVSIFLFSHFSTLLFFFILLEIRPKPTQGLTKPAGPTYLNEGEIHTTSTRPRIDGECVRIKDDSDIG
jgi:hypothetical protein